jgi:hypothetical protein
MKRLIILLTILPAISVAHAAIGVRLGAVTGTAGETVTVPLYVDSTLTAGDGVFSYQFRIGFNANYVDILNVDASEGIAGEFSPPAVAVTTGSVSIASAGSAPMTGSGVLLTMTFQLKTAGSTALTFQNTAEANYFNEGNPAMLFFNGSINVQPRPVIDVRYTSSSLPLLVGETLKCTASGGSAPYTWTVDNTGRAEINSEGLLTALKSGTVRVTATDANGYAGTSAGIEIRSFKAAVRDTTYYQNNRVEIPVLFDNQETLPVYSGQFTVTFNESVLSLEAILTDNGLLASDNLVEIKAAAGQVRVSFANSQGFTASGVLFTMRFRVADRSSGGTYLEFSQAEVNETQSAKPFRGYFTVKPLPDLTVAPATIPELFAGETLQLSVSGGTAPYTWTSGREPVASVSADGLVSAGKGGTTAISVEDVYGANKTVNITVYDTEIQPADTMAIVNKYEFDLPVVLKRPVDAARGFTAVQGVISCNRAEIDSIKISVQDALSASWAVAQRQEGKSCIFALSGSRAITEAGVLFYATVYFNGNAAVNNRFTFTLGDLLLNEGSPVAKVRNGTMEIKELAFVGIETIAAPQAFGELRITVADGVLKITGYAGGDVRIFDISGRAAGAKNFPPLWNGAINISHLPKGTYIVKAGNKTAKFVRK